MAWVPPDKESRFDHQTNDEIAARLGCARRTVAWRLDLILRIWLAEGA